MQPLEADPFSLIRGVGPRYLVRGDEWGPEAPRGIVHTLVPNVQRVWALVDTGADCSLVYGNPELFPGPAICIDG